jgi:MFS family permease
MDMIEIFKGQIQPLLGLEIAFARGSTIMRRLAGMVAMRRQELSQLALAATAMVAVASVQEAWSLFVTPLQMRLGGGPAALVQVQTAFSVFIVCQTVAVPLSGVVADQHPPSVTLVPAALAFGGGWWLSARAETLWALSLSIGLCAVGVGTVYSTCTAHAVKWFPRNRGLAAGVTSCGYGAGAGLFLFQLQASIAEHGASATVEWWSVGLGSVVMATGLLMRPAPTVAAAAAAADDAAADKALGSATTAGGGSTGKLLLPLDGRERERSVPPGVVIRQPLFHWCYLAMMLIAMTVRYVTSLLIHIR